MSGVALAEPAPAKVNLTLRVLGRRADGYHELDSLVVFAGIGDRVALTPGAALALDVSGPTAEAAGPGPDNLILKAAGALLARVSGLKLGRFALDKRLPVAAGLGGGSADAAAALRLLARVNGLGLDDPRLRDAARATGADVPVCLDPRSRVMRGTGDVLSGPLELPALPALLVNPRVPVATRDVFAALRAKPLSNSSAADPARFAAPTPAALVELLRGEPNDLEAPAIALQPAVAEVLSRLRATPGALLARMSGSGATCFALYATPEMAAAAGRELAASYPGWWICATVLGRPQ